jgi:predicted nucleic acid-binding protein
VRDVISNTSPLQYLHQTDLLELIPQLYDKLVVGPAVVHEIDNGRKLGLSLPDPSDLPWVEIRPVRQRTILPMVVDLGEGERETLALGIESPGALLILDDGLARQHARHLGLSFTGTLGVLIKAKKKGLIPAVRPVLDRLLALGFRVDAAIYDTVLRLAGES